MDQVLNITSLNTEEFTGFVTGFGNFAAYIDLRGLQVGDELTVNMYKDIVTPNDNVLISSAPITEATQVIAGDNAALELPITVGAGKTARIGITLTTGTTPLLIPVEFINMNTGA